MLLRTIYVLWYQGMALAPETVKLCITTWAKWNPDFIIIYIDKNNVTSYIKDIAPYLDRNIPIQALSDIIRIMLLKTHGGLWVDATVFCKKPLIWLEKYAYKGFWAFDKPHDRPIASWFLYGEPDNYIVQQLYNKVIEYWLHRKQYDNYYWFHTIFGKCLNNDPLFYDLWNEIPKINAHTSLTSSYLLKDKTDASVLHINEAHVLKLNHRPKNIPVKSNLHYILWKP